MHGFDLAPHVLDNQSIVGMALWHAAQLANVDGFAQVHLHRPPNPIGKRDNVLGLHGEVGIDLLVQLCCLVHRACKVGFEAGFFDLLRNVVAVGSREVLALLGQQTVPLQVSVQT